MKSANRTSERRFLVLVAAFGVLASMTYAAEPTALSNGVAVTGLSGGAGTEQFYKIDVPAGQDTLSISTSGGTGDVDLYVRRNSLPTTLSYDHRPFKVGNNETVDVNTPAAGTWYIMLRGYTSYSGVTLKATYEASVSVKSLANGVPATGIEGPANGEMYYSIEVPAGQAKLEIAMSGGTGDADLYVKRGSLPTTTSYDYRPFLLGNNETVSVETPDGGTWYIMIRGYSLFSGVTLLASFGGGGTTPGVTPLEDGVPVTNLSGAAASEKLFQIDLPPGQTSLEIRMSGGTGDADLFVKLKTPPTTTSYDYRPFLAGNEESVNIEAPAAGTWFVMIRGYSNYANVTLQASWGQVVTLQNGVPVPNLAGDSGSEKFFKITAPAGTDEISFAISGGTGNADMYLKKGSKPTTSSYDYRPSDPGNGNTESVGFSGDSVAGTWYILLKAAKAYEGVTLSVKYAVKGGSTPGIVTLSNGVPVANIAGTAGTERFYKIDVPAGQQKLEIQMSGGTGDADLYVRRGSVPTTSQYDYRPYLLGNNETVAVDNPAAGTWYIMIRGYQAFAGVTLVATYGGGTTPGPDPITTLQNGVAVTGLKSTTSSERFYKIDVPAGQQKLEIVVSGGTGDVDLYVRRGSKPTQSEWDYRPYLLGNNETVSITNPAAGTYYIMLKAYAAYDGVTLKATYTPVPEQITTLTNGVAVTGLSGTAGSEKFYKIDVPASQSFLTIEISGGTGDVDLYVKRGSKPTITSWDYRPFLIGNTERVDVTKPATATWYIMLRGYLAYAGVTLKATYGTSAPPAPSGNNFASDPDCVALWRFESTKVTTDSVGTHTLQNQGVTTVAADKKEGGSSAQFKASEKRCLWIPHAALAPAFPFSGPTAPKTISIAFWMKLSSLPPAGQTRDPISKADDVKGVITFTTMVGDGGSVGFFIGTPTSQKYEDVWTPPAVVTGKWYHVVITYQDSDRSYRLNVWSEESGTVVANNTGTMKSNITVSDADVYLGTRQGLPATRFFDGLLDEMVIFKDVLTPDEMAQIRTGTYGKSK